MEIPSLPLNDGNSIPLLGFGTGTDWFKENSDESLNLQLVGVFKTALRKGFRHLDCSDCYGTEREVGIAIKESGIPREELFVTTKVQEALWKNVPQALEDSLRRLQLEYVDLYLLYPPSFCHATIRGLHRTWADMEAIKASGKAKSIGVSNMQRPRLESILKVATADPAVAQFTYYPSLPLDRVFVGWMEEAAGIRPSTFKEVFQGDVTMSPLWHGTLRSMAQSHGVATEIMVLKWALCQNMVVITAGGNEEGRMDAYLGALSLELTPEEQETVDQLQLTRQFSGRR